MSANIDENLRHEKVQAVIAKLISESNRISSEIAKVSAETTKINTENKFYPLVLCTAFGSAFTVAVFAVLKLYV